jgi:hypothetical protein
MFGIKQINIKVKMLSFSFLEYNKIIYMTLITNIYIYIYIYVINRVIELFSS